MNELVTQYINEAPEEHKQIMQEVRQLLHQAVPQVQESFKWSRPVFGTDKDFAYFKAAKSYVSLGFYDASKLNDPNGLLEGTGKAMRHIKIKKAADIDRELMLGWFKRIAE
ncbi:hypothetical protein BH09BAC1_BH09BAC1_02960 [soil metagenome]